MQPEARKQAQVKAQSIEQSPIYKAIWLGLMSLVLVVAQTLVAFAKPESLAPLAEQISPSVVNITTSTLVEGRTGPRGIVRN